MSAEAVKIYLVGDASYTVDFTNLNPDVQYVKNNPLFIIPYGSGKQVLFNTQLLSVRLTITFDLLDGNGTGSNFQKLDTLSNKKGGAGITEPIIFEWGSKKYYVMIESLIVNTKAGRKDFMQGCQMVVVPALEVEDYVGDIGW